ncbi:MAG: hypothetical protein KBA61_16410 [Spirochaetes bacterium]|nr:hypothetical protein [Spirochaetota bacterium]
MKKRSTTMLLTGFIIILLFALLAGDGLTQQTVTNPDQASPHYALIEGLKLIKNGQFDKWVSTWCSKTELCYNNNSVQSLKRYNLPVQQRRAGQCLKGNGASIQVTRTDGNPAKDSQVKIFILCEPKGMPRPYTLIKDNGWKFKSI